MAEARLTNSRGRALIYGRKEKGSARCWQKRNVKPGQSDSFESVAQSWFDNRRAPSYFHVPAVCCARGPCAFSFTYIIPSLGQLLRNSRIATRRPFIYLLRSSFFSNNIFIFFYNWAPVHIFLFFSVNRNNHREPLFLRLASGSSE